MKILLISPLPPPVGGIATWTVKYKDYCETHNISLAIVNNALHGSRAKQINAKRNILDEVSRTYRVIFDMCRKIRKEKPNVIHLNSSCSRFGVYRDCICAIIGRTCSIPIVLQCHCNIQDQVRGRLAEFAFKVMTSMSQRVLVLNRFSAEYARRFAGEKVMVVPNFADEQDVIKRKSIAGEIRQIVFVGHVRREKGAAEIFEVAEQFPEIRFTMVGPIQKEMEDLPHGSNVELMGAQSREAVIELLRNADAFLFPSYTEGFANALLEAMAAGLPVIATDVGANVEMLESKGGIIIPTRDSDAIAGAIELVKSDSELRSCMSDWNIKKVRNAYLLRIVMLRLMQIYKEVLG